MRNKGLRDLNNLWACEIVLSKYAFDLLECEQVPNLTRVCVRDTATRKEQSSPLEQGMLSYLECNNHRAIPGLWKYHMVSSIEDMTYMETCPQLYITMSLVTAPEQGGLQSESVNVCAYSHAYCMLEWSHMAHQWNVQSRGFILSRKQS